METKQLILVVSLIVLYWLVSGISQPYTYARCVNDCDVSYNQTKCLAVCRTLPRGPREAYDVCVNRLDLDLPSLECLLLASPPTWVWSSYEWMRNQWNHAYYGDPLPSPMPWYMISPFVAACLLAIVGGVSYEVWLWWVRNRRNAKLSLALAKQLSNLIDDTTPLEALVHANADGDGALVAYPELVPGTDLVVLPNLPKDRVKMVTRPAAENISVVIKRGREYVTRQMGRPTPTAASLMLARRHWDRYCDDYVGLRRCDRVVATNGYLRTCCIPDRLDIAVAETYADKAVLKRIKRGALPSGG
jgi:hypothetical protein